jgi:Tripartite tricarboxylate transporter TctB family
MAADGAGRRRWRTAVGELTIAAGVIVLAVVVCWQVLVMPVSPLYAKVGPTLVPTLVVAALFGLGFALLLAGVRGGWQTEEERAAQPDRPALGWIVGGLALNVLLIDLAGFTIASTILFVCVARGFGSRRGVRDAVFGATFALVAYFGFAKTLGINIGAGLAENAIETLLPFSGKR